MPSDKPTKNDDVLLIVQIVQVTGRLGLSMAGAMCGTFVAAQLTMTNAELFDSAGFIALMVLVGILGFYLGIDLPRLRDSLPSPSSTAKELIRWNCFPRSERFLPPSPR
jgi:hypothetical protein